MKKTIVSAVVAAIITALLFGFYQAGYREGKRHVIEDSIIWTVEVYDPGNDAYPLEDYDQIICIDIDGDLYEHGMVQG